MTLSHLRVTFTVACLAAFLALSACGGSSGKKSSAQPPRPSSSSAGRPTSNATESAPPGDIPDNQAFVPFTPVGQGFTVQVPEGWAMTQPGGSTVFTDKYNSIRIQKVSAAKAPTVQSAGATEVPALRAGAKGFVPGKVSTVTRHAGTAVKITYKADSAPNPVTDKVILQDVERYEFWRGGTEVILTLSASQGSDNVDPWFKVTDSFGWKP